MASDGVFIPSDRDEPEAEQPTQTEPRFKSPSPLMYQGHLPVSELPARSTINSFARTITSHGASNFLCNFFIHDAQAPWLKTKRINTVKTDLQWARALALVDTDFKIASKN